MGKYTNIGHGRHPPYYKFHLVIYVAVCFFVFMTAFQTTRNQIETLTKADVIIFTNKGKLNLEFWNTWAYISCMHICCCHDRFILFSYYIACSRVESRISNSSFWILVNLRFFTNNFVNNSIWIWSSLLIVYNVTHAATWVVIVITSLINGISAAILWVS